MTARSPARVAFLAALATLVVAAMGMETAIRAFDLYLRKKPIDAADGRLLRALPTETAHWRREGTDELIKDPETLKVMGTENYVTRRYVRKDGPDPARPAMVELHAAYYTGKIDTVPHVPERCFLGGGMTLLGGPWIVDIPVDASGWKVHPEADASERAEGRVLATRLPNEFASAPGLYVRLPRDVAPERPLALRVSRFADPTGREIYAGYFFVANGGWVPSADGVRLLAFNLTNDYAYYMKVEFRSLTPIGGPEELGALAGSLLDDLLGELMRCVPDWTLVERGLYPPDNPRRGRSPAP